MTKTKITTRGDEETANDLIQSEETLSPEEDHGEQEGKLAVDVYETTTELVIIAPVAGVEIDDLDLIVEDDVLTVCGDRHHITKKIKSNNYLSQECFWGKFSRSIILPPNLDSDQISASFKRGILKIQIPKKTDLKQKSIHING